MRKSYLGGNTILADQPWEKGSRLRKSLLLGILAVLVLESSFLAELYERDDYWSPRPGTGPARAENIFKGRSWAGNSVSEEAAKTPIDLYELSYPETESFLELAGGESDQVAFDPPLLEEVGVVRMDGSRQVEEPDKLVHIVTDPDGSIQPVVIL